MIIARTTQCSTSHLGEVTHHCGVESHCIYTCNKTHLHFQNALHSSGTIRQFQLSTMFSFYQKRTEDGSQFYHFHIISQSYLLSTVHIPNNNNNNFLNAKPCQTYLLGILWQELDRLRKGPDRGSPTKPG
jgi:hypothetical protein